MCMLQVRHLFDTGESREMRIEIENVINASTPKLARNGLYPLHFINTPLICLYQCRILLQSLLLKCNNETIFTLENCLLDKQLQGNIKSTCMVLLFRNS